jgi:hypothetical protein
MAGLITEAKARAEEMEWKQALAAERETMRDALAKLKPQLQKLVGTAEPAIEPRPVYAAEPTSCEQCGNHVEAHQLFCAACGAERNAPDETENSQARGRAEFENSTPVLSDETLDQLQASLTEIGEQKPEFAQPESQNGSGEEPASSGLVPANHSASADATKTDAISPWRSAARAKAWLESLSKSEKSDAVVRFWKFRRADVYLGIAVVVAVIAVVWAMRSGSENASSAISAKPAAGTVLAAPLGKTTAKRQAPPEPKLSVTDRVLISLGLADPPPAPVYEGNPDAKVWVDLHTALYYCPGSQLYGRTAKGKFTTQRDAQLDQFEPAARKACE